MSTLYRAITVESPEHLSALPGGTFIHDPAMSAFYVDAPPGHPYEGEFIDVDGDVLLPGDAVGWTALAPIEAEVCHSEDYGSYHLMEAVDGPKPFTAYLVDQEEA